jgi:hypothetical protein
MDLIGWYRISPAINQMIRSKHSVIPNSYTPLSKIPPDHQWFSGFDLKNAFWACSLVEDSRDIFAFE